MTSTRAPGADRRALPEGARGRWPGAEPPLVRDLNLDKIDLRRAAERTPRPAALVATLINKTSRGTIQVLVLLFTTLFTMFYFFRDGKDLLRRVRALIPLDREYKNAIAARFSSVARATVRGRC